ncbi:NADP-dependent oxidoreductase domain-containing protein 1 [Myripristis murdjan]|uniref:NADP-dependent oxidoreductase domain-containing protein 1 n=1 Tax=Myripristis murdjan TaxID=586833 RepID=UPI0011761B97|nr:NADP-dependent oxidoreductase domain-containing protein 1 [Myripristis murdjan]
MQDLTAGLSTFSFDCGLTEDQEELLSLRARSAALSICGCAHAVFWCQLAHSLRGLINRHTTQRVALASERDSDLRVGILGLGHTGKQLLLCLLEKTDTKPSHIKISTRRPETAAEFAQSGVECYFDNGRLAAWADVLFLCCLPSHLPKVCASLHSHLPPRCLIYSFLSAVPVTRLARLLGHSFVLKPQYDFSACDRADMWPAHGQLITALNDPLLIEASCPLSVSGGISLGASWVYAVLYSLLNICTSASLGSRDALALINSLFLLKEPNTVEFNAQSYVNASYASALMPDEPFPWITLTDAQTKETPLSRFLSRSKSVQEAISAAYKALLEKKEMRDWGMDK